jgi:hypothetical protein
MPYREYGEFSWENANEEMMENEISPKVLLSAAVVGFAKCIQSFK